MRVQRLFIRKSFDVMSGVKPLQMPKHVIDTGKAAVRQKITKAGGKGVV